MNAQEMLENLTELYAQRDLLAVDRKRAEKDVMPQAVIDALADVASEYAPKESAVSDKINELEAQVKEAVLASETTAKGGSLQAVYSKPRITWETKGLDGLIVAIPELNQFRRVGAPSVSIRKV